MSRIFLSFFIIFSFSYGASQKLWDFEHSFNLKKDKIAIVNINKNVKNKKNNNRYSLKFRWTLYANKTLILLANYMGYPYQFVLKRVRQLDRVEIKLLGDSGDFGGRTYALLVFSDFDEQKNVATIGVYIKDEARRIKVDFIEPKKGV